jgi:hypothetical protein
MELDDIASEYRGALLGDPRRTKRLERIACELARNPGLSFPEAIGSEGQLEGLYRFSFRDVSLRDRRGVAREAMR